MLGEGLDVNATKLRASSPLLTIHAAANNGHEEIIYEPTSISPGPGTSPFSEKQPKIATTVGAMLSCRSPEHEEIKPFSETGQTSRFRDSKAYPFALSNT